MRRILVPLDGSALAESALGLAEALGRGSGAELLLLHIVPPGARPTRGLGTYLARRAGEVRTRGLREVSWVIWPGSPEHAIARAAQERGADLIAMTAHGQRPAGGLLFGSVAEGVMRESAVPLLLLRARQAWGPRESGRVLVPLDRSNLSEAVLPVVERLVRPLGLGVELLHVVDVRAASAVDAEARRREILQAEADEYLSALAAALGARGISAGWSVRIGRAAEVIPVHAWETRAGLIAMTMLGPEGLGRLLFGSVAEAVSRSAPAPVLLLKPGDAGWAPRAAEAARV